MVFNLAIKNIMSSVAQFRRVYILMLVSQFIAVLSIFFAYGIFAGYSSKMEELVADSYMFWAEITDSDMGSLREGLPEILNELENRMDFVLVDGYSDVGMIQMHSEYHNGKFYASETIMNNIAKRNDSTMTGRYLSDKDFLNAAPVCFYCGIGSEDKNVIIGGIQFKIIGESGDGATECWAIPFTACPDEVPIRNVVIVFRELPTKDDYLMFKNTLVEIYGEKVTVDDFEFKDNEELVSMRTIIAISVAIGIISALNICLLYGYIISRRMKQMAVYGITGATKLLRLAINESEIMLVSLIIELLGFVVFRVGPEQIFSMVYENSGLYSTKVYMVMLISYSACIFLITYIMLRYVNREKLRDMLRRAQNG